jgi:uncharacterized Tic20 family protein
VEAPSERHDHVRSERRTAARNESAADPSGAQDPQQPYAAPPSGAAYAGAPYASPAPPLSADQDRLWASLSHFGGIIGPIPVLIIWLVLKDRGQRTNVEGKEALNWQITFTIGYFVLWIITAILGVALFFTPIAAILWLLPFAWWVLDVVFSIMGGVRVNAGGSYRYPFALRLIH